MSLAVRCGELANRILKSKKLRTHHRGTAFISATLPDYTAHQLCENANRHSIVKAPTPKSKKRFLGPRLDALRAD